LFYSRYKSGAQERHLPNINAIASISLINERKHPLFPQPIKQHKRAGNS